MRDQRDHALETHLPFLQETLDEFEIVPLLVGDAQADEVEELLRTLWGGAETLIAVSSDLSHYLRYDEAVQRDLRTAEAIQTLDSKAVGSRDACGFLAIQGLLRNARETGAQCQELDLRNSGDTAGPRDSVVGYGAFCLG